MPDQRRSAAPPPAPPRPSELQPPRANSPIERRPPFQFGLRSLLILITVVALISPLIPGYGASILIAVVLTILMVVVPVTLGTFALYCRGYRQTFFLGAFAASLCLHVFGGFGLRGELGWIAALAVIQAFACATCGFVAVASRRFIERRRWHLPDDASRS
jgi:hypothetical protein